MRERKRVPELERDRDRNTGGEKKVVKREKGKVCLTPASCSTELQFDT